MADKPNILWIYGEDLYPNLACYGTPAVQTPNIDQFASEGTLFTNAFVTCPVCSASRSGIITGRYQTSFCAHNHRSRRGPDEAPLSEDIRLITDYFRDADYYTCNSPGPPFDKPGKTDFNFKREGVFDGIDWSERAEGQPFYAQNNITDTHRNFTPDPDNPINPDAVYIPPYYPDHPLIRKDWAMYLESIQVFDTKVGQVIQRLKDEGVYDNTIVFIIADHGRAHIRDKQFLYDGGIRVPCIVRWPGHIEAGVVSDELVSGIDFAPTSLSLAGLDVPETMEGNVFLGADAKSRAEVVSARDRCDGTVDRIRCVRTKEYKYIRNYHPERAYMQFNGYKYQQYPLWTLLPLLAREGKLTDAQSKFLAPSRPYEELYDLQSDPHELNDLAKSEDHHDVLKDLSARLDNWTETYGDQGAIPEDPAIIAEQAEDMYAKHLARMKNEHGVEHELTPEEYMKVWEKKLMG